MPAERPNPTNLHPDWTRGPAKWAAVVVLGLAASAALVYTVRAGPPSRGSPSAQAPIAKTDEPTTERPSGTTAADPPLIQWTGSGGTVSSLLSLDVNTATVAEFQALPGIGPTLAQRIVDHRTRHGPFRRLEDLRNVRGIGPTTLRKIRPHLRTIPPPPAP